MVGPDGEIYSYENLRTQGWLDGHKPGVEMAVGWLRNEAIQLFTYGQDERAIALRKMAERMEVELVKIVDERAKEHRTAYPEMVVGKDTP